jgi:hypothetical protein
MYIRTKVGIACCPAIRPSGGASFNEFIGPLLRPLHSIRAGPIYQMNHPDTLFAFYILFAR